MTMISMKMSADARKEYAGETIAQDSPEYPYGLCLRLDDDALKKLGLTEIPAVGTEVMVVAKAIVKSTSAHASEGETDRSVEVQITDLEFGTVSSASSAASVLYGE